VIGVWSSIVIGFTISGGRDTGDFLKFRYGAFSLSFYGGRWL